MTYQLHYSPTTREWEIRSVTTDVVRYSYKSLSVALAALVLYTDQVGITSLALDEVRTIEERAADHIDDEGR